MAPLPAMLARVASFDAAGALVVVLDAGFVVLAQAPVRFDMPWLHLGVRATS
jgi:hypothetical protein